MARIDDMKILERLDRLADRHPSWFRARTLLVAMLGYVVLGGALALVLVGMIATIAMIIAAPKHSVEFVKGLAVLAAIGVFIVNAMWVYFPPPRGARVGPRESAALVAEVERLRRAMSVPRIDEILITDEATIRAVALPRAGIFGWHRRYLQIGLPLMLAMDRQRLSALIALAILHHGRRQGAVRNWIFRIRQTWRSLLDGLNDDHKQVRIRQFFAWYVPYFEAHCRVLERKGRLAMDRAAADVVGVQPLAHALATSIAVQRFLEVDFWPSIAALSTSQPMPPDDAFARMAREIRTLTGETIHAWLDNATRHATQIWDPDASAGDRLRALGGVAIDVRVVVRDAAEEYLLPMLPDLFARFGKRWADLEATAWGMRFRVAEGDRERLEELESRLQDQDIDANDAVEAATLLCRQGHVDEAKTFLQAGLSQGPELASAHWMFGRLMLDDDLELAAEHLERAMSLDPNMIMTGAEALAHAFDAIDPERARGYRARLDEYRASRETQARERHEIDGNQTFAPHGLDPRALAPFVRSLSLIDSLARAWLARKQVSQGPSHFVLLVDLLGPRDEARLQRIAEITGLPGTFQVVRDSWTDGLAKSLRRAGRQPIFTRGWSAPRLLLERLIKYIVSQQQ